MSNHFTHTDDLPGTTGGFTYTPISAGRPLRREYDPTTNRYWEQLYTARKKTGQKPPANEYGSSRPSKEAKSKKTSTHLNRFFLFLIIFLSITLLLEIVFNFIIAPKLKIRKVEIHIDRYIDLSKKQVSDLAGLHANMYYYNTDIDTITENLKKYSPVKTATVEKVFPDTLLIDLKGRKPLVLSLVDTVDGTVPVALDEEGVIFQIGSSVTNWNYPIVSGVKFSELKLGMKLPSKLQGFLKDIESIRENSPAIIEAISEFRFVKKDSMDFEVVLYPKQFEIPVRIGSELDERLLKYIFMVLDVISRADYADQIEEIDCRTDQIVYRYKEG